MKHFSTPEEAARALLQGREEGLDFFFHQYYLPLSWFAEKLLRDSILAEDIIADSFIKLWNHRHTLERPEAIRAYLYSTVRNACIDQIRKKIKTRSHHENFYNLHLPTEEEVLHQVIETETWHQIYRAISQLPPRCGQVFIMYYLEEMSYQQIADALDISVHTVRNQKVRAVELMRKKLPPHLMALLLSFALVKGNYFFTD